MNTSIKRTLSLFLALTMLLTAMPLVAFAEEPEQAEPVEETDPALAEFEHAIEGIFREIQKKPGVFYGTYDDENNKADVAIINGEMTIKDVKNTGLIALSRNSIMSITLRKFK